MGGLVVRGSWVLLRVARLLAGMDMVEQARVDAGNEW
jgi:hypothetical protein